MRLSTDVLVQIVRPLVGSKDLGMRGTAIVLAMNPVLDAALDFFGTPAHSGGPGEPQRTGFYVSVGDQRSGDVVHTVRFGDMMGPGYDGERRRRYERNAANKVRFAIDRDVETSWDIRDDKADPPIYPGSVRMIDWHLAVSGLSSGHKDQAVVLVGGMYLHVCGFFLGRGPGIGPTKAFGIAERTQDPEFEPFLAFVRSRGIF